VPGANPVAGTLKFFVRTSPCRFLFFFENLIDNLFRDSTHSNSSSVAAVESVKEVNIAQQIRLMHSSSSDAHTRVRSSLAADHNRKRVNAVRPARRANCNASLQQKKNKQKRQTKSFVRHLPSLVSSFEQGQTAVQQGSVGGGRENPALVQLFAHLLFQLIQAVKPVKKKKKNS
jgi:hypothetical protein